MKNKDMNKAIYNPFPLGNHNNGKSSSLNLLLIFSDDGSSYVFLSSFSILYFLLPASFYFFISMISYSGSESIAFLINVWYCP